MICRAVVIMSCVSVCVSGVLTAEEEAWVSERGNRCVLPRMGSTLYLGARCADGRPVEESWKVHEARRLGIPVVYVHEAMGVRNKGKGKGKGEGEEKEKGKGELWTERYKPVSLSEVIGHKAEIQVLRGWLALWEQGEKAVEKRGVLITGPPGIGKTTVVHLLAKEYGYAVTEYNASDTRSVSSLRGCFALGVRRLRREVIVMDEVDGLCERGGVVEVATMIRKTTVPFFCIANERGGKLAPLTAVCAEMRFSRPLRSTIAVGMERILRAEGRTMVSREELEAMCERNGNDLRAILHQLEFLAGGAVAGAGATGSTPAGHDKDTPAFHVGATGSTPAGHDKDATHRLDPFSVTQRLFAAKKMPFAEAENLVFVDSHLIPLMVQEAYVHAGQDDMECIAKAADAVSRGDGMTRRVYQTQDWGLVPHAVAASLDAVRRVPGKAPFQIFPQVLGKMSKQRKHARWMEDMSKRCGVKSGLHSGKTFRLDIAEGLRRMVTDRLLREGAPFRALIQDMDHAGLTRDDVFEALEETALGKGGVEIPTKIRSAFTREWNKGHGAEIVSKGKSSSKGKGKAVGVAKEEEEEGDEEEEGEEERKWEEE